VTTVVFIVLTFFVSRDQQCQNAVSIKKPVIQASDPASLFCHPLGDL